jgi:hypothetical protein
MKLMALMVILSIMVIDNNGDDSSDGYGNYDGDNLFRVSLLSDIMVMVILIVKQCNSYCNSYGMVMLIIFVIVMVILMIIAMVIRVIVMMVIKTIVMVLIIMMI